MEVEKYERIRKILTSNDVKKEIERNIEELLSVIPEIKEMIGFPQKHPNHHLDVWEHTLAVVNNLNTCDLILNTAGLLHDIGKTRCYQEDGEFRHFYGHPEKSAEMAEVILTRLGYSQEEKAEILYLVKNHDTKIDLDSLDNSIDMIWKRLQLQYADARAHHPDKVEERIVALDDIRVGLEQKI